MTYGFKSSALHLADEASLLFATKGNKRGQSQLLTGVC